MGLGSSRRAPNLRQVADEREQHAARRAEERRRQKQRDKPEAADESAKLRDGESDAHGEILEESENGSDG